MEAWWEAAAFSSLSHQPQRCLQLISAAIKPACRFLRWTLPWLLIYSRMKLLDHWIVLTLKNLLHVWYDMHWKYGSIISHRLRGNVWMKNNDNVLIWSMKGYQCGVTEGWMLLEPSLQPIIILLIMVILCIEVNTLKIELFCTGLCIVFILNGNCIRRKSN